MRIITDLWITILIKVNPIKGHLAQNAIKLVEQMARPRRVRARVHEHQKILAKEDRLPIRLPERPIRMRLIEGDRGGVDRREGIAAMPCV